MEDPMAIFCVSCGKEVNPGSKFCKECGTIIETVEGAGAVNDASQAPAGSEAAGDTAAGAATGAADTAQGASQAQPSGTTSQSGAGTHGGGASTGGGTGQSGQQLIDKLMDLLQNTADHTDKMDPSDVTQNKGICCLSYPLFFLPFVACPESKFGRFHANQGLLFAILLFAGLIANSIVRMIFRGFLYWLGSLMQLAILLPILAIGVISVINAYSGKAKEIPLIGNTRLIK
jgi:uncharacterized membrane protein